MKSKVNPFRVLIKALCLFVIINIVYGLVNPQDFIVSGYNVLFPGRTRLPFVGSGDPYSVAVDDLDTLFASHAISARKGAKEYRVVVIGDSSVWGEGLGAYEVMTEQWNKLNIRCGDKVIKSYDLGYPHPSAIKDLMILNKATEYEPDLIVWFVTLNTLMSQRINPFLVANHEQAVQVLDKYGIVLQGGEQLEDQPGFYEKTLISQRSNLARRIKLEMLGIIWSATHSDTDVLAENDRPDLSVSDDLHYRGLQPSDDISDMLLFNALAASSDMAGPVPVLIVNEPIFITSGKNSVVRYNAVYPRWVYDQYREYLAAQARHASWNYLDLWNAIPPTYFSDAGLHRSVEGERLLIQQINPALQAIGCNTKP